MPELRPTPGSAGKRKPASRPPKRTKAWRRPPTVTAEPSGKRTEVAAPAISIINAVDHPQLWGPWFRDERTWRPWRAFLSAVFGLRLDADGLRLFQECTSRSAPAPGGYRETWLVVGRRGGKSFILAVIAVFLAVFRDWRPYLAPGEFGFVKILAVDQRQARVIHRYCRALLAEAPPLAGLITRETEDALWLGAQRIVIEVTPASFRSVRGFTVVAALCDELAYWRSDEGSASPDAEVLAAIRPAMSTVPGSMLLCASSPYAKRGELWNSFRRYHGKDDASALVWHAPTSVMNPTVRQRVIEEALAEDPAKAGAEYLAQFRSDIEGFLTRDAVEAVTVPGRLELPPARGVSYVGFVDPSGGSSDSMTLAVAHRDRDGRGILDLVREIRAPFSPEAACAEFAATLRGYRIGRVEGDRYAGEWPREQFAKRGISYQPAQTAKTDLYSSLLPLINSGRVELLDLPRLVSQLTSLERRTGRGTGKDNIDHPPGAGWHDDIANAAAGALVLATLAKRGPQVSIQLIEKMRLYRRPQEARRARPLVLPLRQASRTF